MAISGALAVTNQSIEGVFNTSSIDISLKTFMTNRTDDNTEEIEYVNDKVVFSGDEIGFVPKIYNLKEECYLRIKIDYINSDVDFRDYITGFSEKFEKHGNYYYYNRAVNENEIIKIFDTIKIPDNVDHLVSGNLIKLDIIAEAIQANNFEPDYTKEDPWNGVEPTENERSSYGIDISDSEIILKYEDKTEEDITVPEDFMEDTKNTLPGDIFTENMTIKNDSSEKAKYYMKIEIDEEEQETAELLDKIKLKITKGETVVYDGPFVSEEKIILSELNINETEDIEFRIEIPEDLSNEYTNVSPKFSIIFSADREEKKEDPPKEEPPEEEPPKEEPNPSPTIEEKPETTIVITPNTDKSIVISNPKKIIKNVIPTPNTGDRIDIVLLIFLLSALGLIITMVLDYKERKKENK